MQSFKKFLPYILIAVIFLVGGYFLGKGVAMNQDASLYKTAITKTPAGLVHLFFSNGTCNIFQWNASNNTWVQIGTLGGVKERDCHDLAPAPTGSAPVIYSSVSPTPIPGITKSDVLTYAGVINMGWIDGIGCNIFRWDDASKSWISLGVATGIDKAHCTATAVHPEVPLTAKSTITTPSKTR